MAMENNTDGKEMAEKLDEFADMIMTETRNECKELNDSNNSRYDTPAKRLRVDISEGTIYRTLPTQNGSDCFMDKFDEPASAYTLKKVLTNQFKCKCFDGMWCYAKGNQRPCDAGLISQNAEMNHE